MTVQLGLRCMWPTVLKDIQTCPTEWYVDILNFRYTTQRISAATGWWQMVVSEDSARQWGNHSLRYIHKNISSSKGLFQWASKPHGTPGASVCCEPICIPVSPFEHRPLSFLFLHLVFSRDSDSFEANKALALFLRIKRASSENNKKLKTVELQYVNTEVTYTPTKKMAEKKKSRDKSAER